MQAVVSTVWMAAGEQSRVVGLKNCGQSSDRSRSCQADRRTDTFTSAVLHILASLDIEANDHDDADELSTMAHVMSYGRRA